MRKNIVAGNWKMNLNRFDGVTLVEEFLKKSSLENKTEVIFATSFIQLYK